MTKRISNDPFVWICFAAFLFFTVYYAFRFFEASPAATLHEAQMSYLSAEREPDLAKRQEGFNQSLKMLLELEKKYSPIFGNGKLYFDLGNNFFQLEEYPFALLNYYRARNLRPLDEKVQAHIELTKKKIGIPIEANPSAFEWLFFFHHHYSLPQRLQWLAGLNILFLALTSAFLWFSYRVFYYSAIITGAAGLLFFCSVTYSYAFTPLEAVITTSSLLYRDAGTHYAKVKPDPLISGSKVKILNASMGGKWLKIETQEGVVGYVPEDTLRAI